MLRPKYNISNKLLNNIKTISVLCAELNNQAFPRTVLANFEAKADSLSTYASTSIEGNPIPLTDVKRLIRSTPENIRDTEREILNYNNALENLKNNIAKDRILITEEFVCAIQLQITAGLLEKHGCGKFRAEPVFVNDPRSGKPVYLPPDHQDVSRLMIDLLDFIKQQRGIVDALILAGIFHKQFVIIHPFVDGNGRTSRLITKALLADMGLNTFNLFSFENYYNKNVTKYFEKVGACGNYYEIESDLDFTEWLEYFTDGIIDELLRAEMVSPETTLQSHHNKILNFIDKNGFVTDRDYSKMTTRAKATRALDFKKLLNLGLIERFGRGRAVYYKKTGP
jgi:Fic family protein